MIVGSGIDVIEIARIERILAGRRERFEQRVFTDDEVRVCRSAARPAPHYAARFAAKEAAMKAVGTGWAQGVGWRDIETRSESGRPGDCGALVLHGRAQELAAELADERGGQGPVHTHLAIGRSRTHAVAFVLLERGEA